MPVKGNQPTLQAAIERLLAHAQQAQEAAAPQTTGVALGLAAQRVSCVGDRVGWPSVRCASSCAVGHGRVEQRVLQAVSVPAELAWLEWPGRQQVFVVRRTTRFKKRGHTRHETVYGITSLNAAQADAAALLELVRGHWQIENGLHWVRDVTFDEDRSRVRSDHIPQVLAALRNLAIGLLRRAGATNIASACRACAAQPWKALSCLGIQRTE